MNASVWEHWDAMTRAARGVLGGPDEAGDCAAEAIVQFLEQRPQDVDNLEAYLVSITKRRAVDRIRRAERARRRELKVSLRQGLSVVDVAEDVVSRAEALWVDQQAQLLLRPHVYRLVRLIADGMSVDEAALEMGMTKRAAASHLLRARRTMRETIARTLAGLGVLGTGLRRLSSRGVAPATVAAAAFAVLVLCPVLGTTTQPPAPALRLVPQMTADADPDRTASTSGFDQLARVRSRGDAPTRPRARSESVVRVQTPLVGVSLDREDDGKHNGGLVNRLQACLAQLRVEIGGQIGCEAGGESGKGSTVSPLG